ncbi:taste receptor type 2 member 3-like [Suncus etruscus]|uniref:taste receptor type 2 member 3-like n=1 Tax=Suncus etruscus TaxID=109475 RepID=UPI00210FDCB7|nr:taste receptor type 2 member 3-like [Suncus etruscus]
MLGLNKCVFLVVYAIQFILGILGNGFIGLVNGSGWYKGKRLSLSDFVITILALSRILLLWLLLTDGILMALSLRERDDGIGKQILEVIWTFTNDLSLWLVTCLSVLYCLKIANFFNPTFFWLKRRVSRVVECLLLGALFLSSASALSMIHEFKIFVITTGINDTETILEYFRKKSDYELIHGLGMLWNLPPLIVSLTSNFLLILSLGRHMWQMQKSGTNSRDSTTEAHKRAIKIILSFLFLFLLYYLALLMISSSHFLPGTEIIKMIGKIIKLLYPSVHSFILILGHNKLKQAFVQIIWHKPCHLYTGF